MIAYVPFRSARRAAIAAAVVIVLILGVIAAVPAKAAASPTLEASSLTVNGRIDPLGIPGDSPTFGWALESEARAATQTAYAIEVGSSPGLSDVWSSGKVESRDQADVAYEGPGLMSGTRYFWRVRAWDGDGAASDWSGASSFETGLLAATDWNGASWIGKTAPYSSWDDYTAVVDFTLNNAAFGVFLRAADSSNAYMWQLNVGTSTTSVPILAPHRRVGGNYQSLANIDLRSFGFTRAALLQGAHRLTFELVGTSIKTALDGVVIDTRTVSNFATGGVGVRTWGAESVTINALTVTKPNGAVLAAPSFAAGNPFTGGSYANSAVTFTGEIDGMLKTGEMYAPLLRTTFDTVAGKTVASARVYASAHGVYELSLNGEKVGDQELAPGYTEYDKRIQSQTYDVTDQVRAGANGFGAAVGDGWWAGKVGLAGKYQYGSDLSVIARLKISYTDGSTQWVNTGTDWKWAPGPFVATDLQIGETYDARYEQPGWATAEYDADGWAAVRTLPSDTAKLSPQPDEPVRETQVLDTISVTAPVAGVRVYDLGQNMVGVPRVTITGRAGETVKLRHAEVLKPDGTLYTENLRAALATDFYTFASDGTVTYEPTFTQHGFRYIEVSGLASAPSQADVKGVVWGSDLTTTGSLATSNAMLNKLLSNVSWGARGNFLSIPTDTPARDERLGWTGDINVFAPSASYMFDMRGFLGKWMLDVRDEQKADGQIPAVVPSTKGAFDESGPGWQDAVVTVPYALYRAYDDLTAVRQSWPNMIKFYDFAAGRIGNDNLGAYTSSFFTNDDWLSLENTGGANNEVKSTALWADTVRMMAEMAVALDDPRAEEFAARFDAIKAAFVQAYVSADGTVAGGSQTAYALALGMNLVDDATLQKKVGEKFVVKLALTDNHLTTGFIGTPYLLPAMSAIGRDDLAYDMLLKDTYPSWGYEIAKGATTVWERWNSIQPDGSFGPVDMNSFNHYAYGAVVDWMHQNIGGIRIGEAGYRTSIIEPRPGGGLTEAAGEIQTVYGTLSSSWKQVDGALELTVDVPVSTTAEVRIPSNSRWTVTEGGHPLATADGVSKIERDEAKDLTLVTVGSGSYSFRATTDHADMVDVLDQVTAFAATSAGNADLSEAVRARIASSSTAAAESVESALQQAAGDDDAAAATSMRSALTALQSLRSWVKDSGISSARITALTAQIQRIEASIETVLARLAGVVVTLSEPVGVAVGSSVRGSLVVRNDGQSAITGVTGTVVAAGLSAKEIAVSAPRIEPGAQSTITFDIPSSLTARAGAYDIAISLAISTASGELRYHQNAVGWATLQSALVINSVVPERIGSDTTSLVVSVTNAGAGSVSGRAEATVPNGWRSAPSAPVRIQPGATAVVRVPVYTPANASVGAYPVGVGFVDRGETLVTAASQVEVVAPSAPPTEPATDYVDFGDATSENAHSIQASATSGTNSEAGVTRRYANNSTPGAWYSAKVKVVAGQPFILSMKETWNSAGTKDYDILVDDAIVQHVSLVRTDAGQGTSNHQIKVSDPASLDNDGFVTVKFQYPASNAPRQYYDPSIADLWVISTPDTSAPSASVALDKNAVFDEGAYRSAVTLAASAADNVDPNPTIEYWSEGQWKRYSEPVTFDTDGTHEFRYRAADRYGNVSNVEVMTVRIDRSPPAPAIGFMAGPVTNRCVAGKVILVAQVTNTDTVPISFNIDTPYGAKSVASLAAGKTSSYAFTTRQASTPTGEVTVTAKVTRAGKEVVAMQKVTFPSTSCG